MSREWWESPWLKAHRSLLMARGSPTLHTVANQHRRNLLAPTLYLALYIDRPPGADDDKHLWSISSGRQPC